jgi:hypothetical protein
VFQKRTKGLDHWVLGGEDGTSDNGAYRARQRRRKNVLYTVQDMAPCASTIRGTHYLERSNSFIVGYSLMLFSSASVVLVLKPFEDGC